MPAPRQRHYRRGVLPVESEAAFMQKVVQLAGFEGWMAYHTHRSDRSAPGFPDLVLVRDPRLVFAEVKKENGDRRATVAEVASRLPWLRHRDVTASQARWLHALRGVETAVARLPGAGVRPIVEVHLWRPSDWPAITRCLARLPWEGDHDAPSPLP